MLIPYLVAQWQEAEAVGIAAVFAIDSPSTKNSDYAANTRQLSWCYRVEILCPFELDCAKLSRLLVFVAPSKHRAMVSYTAL